MDVAHSRGNDASHLMYKKEENPLHQMGRSFRAHRYRDQKACFGHAAASGEGLPAEADREAGAGFEAINLALHHMARSF